MKIVLLMVNRIEEIIIILKRKTMHKKARGDEIEWRYGENRWKKLRLAK